MSANIESRLRRLEKEQQAVVSDRVCVIALQPGENCDEAMRAAAIERHYAANPKDRDAGLVVILVKFGPAPQAAGRLPH